MLVSDDSSTPAWLVPLAVVLVLLLLVALVILILVFLHQRGHPVPEFFMSKWRKVEGLWDNFRETESAYDLEEERYFRVFLFSKAHSVFISLKNGFPRKYLLLYRTGSGEI